MLAPVYTAASGVEALRHLIEAGAQFEPQIHAMVQATLRMQDDPTVVALSRQRMRNRFAAMRDVIAKIESEGQLSTFQLLSDAFVMPPPRTPLERIDSTRVAAARPNPHSHPAIVGTRRCLPARTSAVRRRRNGPSC